MNAITLIIRALSGVGLCLLLCGCGPKPDAPRSSLEDVIVTGTVTYRERLALPEDAVLHVTLADNTVPDTMLPIEQRMIPLEGRQPPFPFELIVPADRVNDISLYTVRAEIRSGVDLLFESGIPRPVLTHGAPPHIDLVLRHAGDEQAPPLTGTRWNLFELNGQEVDASDALNEPHLVLHFDNHRFSGSTGINQMGGGYALNGAQVSFTPGPMTRMGGPPEAMRLEREVLAALNRVDGWALHTNTLTLRAGSEQVMRLVAARP